jgi:hypothetical protein
MHKIIIVFCFVFLLFSGCDKHSSVLEPKLQSNEILPLVIGNQWSYNSFTYDSSGAITSSQDISYGVSGDTIIDGSKWFKVLGLPTSNRDSGLCVFGHSGPFLLLKYPAAVQDSFYLQPNSCYVYIISIDTTISISFGTFKCYAYELRSPPSLNAIEIRRTINFWSPCVGQIKVESYRSTSTNSRQYLSDVTVLSSVILK